jgi:hypothetical protein
MGEIAFQTRALISMEAGRVLFSGGEFFRE